MYIPIKITISKCFKHFTAQHQFSLMIIAP